MCRMCESENYEALLELQARYCHRDTSPVPANAGISSPLVMSPRSGSPTPFANESSWTDAQFRRGSLSTSFGKLYIHQPQPAFSPVLPRPTSVVNAPYSNSPLASNLLSPPSSPKSTTVPLMRVMEVDECGFDEAMMKEDGRQSGEDDREPCRRFQRQILSRLQAVSPLILETQPQDPRMLMITHPTADFGVGVAGDSGRRFTPPPSPDLYDQKQRRVSSANFFRPAAAFPSSAPCSRKGSALRPHKIRLPSLAELELAGPSSSPISPRLPSTFLVIGGSAGCGKRRVSSPGLVSHTDSRGGIKKPGYGRKNTETLSNNTPFKNGWSFSTAYGRGRTTNGRGKER